MKLTLNGLKEKEQWEKAGVALPAYDIAAVAEETKKSPVWVHFGAGNIFRIFIGGIADTLIANGEASKGITCVETFDFDVVDKIYAPYDNLVLAVTLKADGSTDKRVLGSLTEAIKAQSNDASQWNRLKEIFVNPGLQMISFTITEKGYALKGADGSYFPFIQADIDNGPDKAGSAMAVVCALLYERYKAGKYPLAVVSMDNCSHNGDKLAAAIGAFAEGWSRNGLADKDFESYIKTSGKVSFPWTMIDKITPRPDASIEALLKKDGVEELDPVITGKHTYVAPFVNAEECQYLVIEDNFPNGRPALEKGGLIFTTRETVDKVEKMKVCTCLNPLHTALAVFGYTEGLPVVVNPGILDPKEFLDTVLNVRIPNPFMPDTPQRIATDTSQKLAIRFGETIKAYAADPKLNVGDLKFIPLVFAGWLRYLMGVDDNGKAFTLSSDPRLQELTAIVSGISLGASTDVEAVLDNVLSDASIWGVDLKALGMDTIVCRYFQELIAGPGAVAAVLNKYTS